MHSLLLAVAIGAPPADEPVVRVKIDTITLSDAEQLNGRTVVTTFTVAKPAFTWGEGKALRTIIGPKDSGTVERAVILKGNRLHDADLSAKVTVVGTLRVIRHTGETASSAWTEIRIEE